MNIGLILAGGTGKRMGLKGLPKQFLKLYGKPLICYTLDAFAKCKDIDMIIIPCNKEWIDYTENMILEYGIKKQTIVISGGENRQESILKGLSIIENPKEGDVVVIHDGVRPLIREEIIKENIRMAKSNGNAMTVKQNVETVVVTNSETAQKGDFHEREVTYTLTSPQSFRLVDLLEVAKKVEKDERLNALPDFSMVYAELKKEVYLVKDDRLNIKITTPEDFYYLRSYLELEESQMILGIDEQ